MTLFVVPTPIGNLEDVTIRALRVLREADVVACEDTRRTGKLLKHYEIKKDLVSHHEHNEERFAAELAERAKTEKVALVSDAGMPLVSDPGYRLVSACLAADVNVEVLPGASSLTTALAASGIPADEVVFLGFPPRKGRERKELFERISDDRATFVLFESPKRLRKTLGELPEDASVAVCRELTKMHEEVFRGSVSEAVERFAGDVKGEIVVVVRGGAEEESVDLSSAVALAKRYASEGESPSRAAARAARDTGRPKGEVYDGLAKG
jgi:16S rRNA (cytidine1402-2'-O)-methyltransferase